MFDFVIVIDVEIVEVGDQVEGVGFFSLFFVFLEMFENVMYYVIVVIDMRVYKGWCMGEGNVEFLWY